MEGTRKKGKAVVIGGSIAGLCCAHSLIGAGWEVVVLEKTSSPPSGCATGAGLGLDPLAQKIIRLWLKQTWDLDSYTLPLTIDQNRATDVVHNKVRILTKDENFNFRAAYWSDLHRLLHMALPKETVQWGNVFLSFCYSDDKTSVKVKAKALQSNCIYEVIGDLLVAADGCLSSIRQGFYPDLKLRYAGYCAWRGVYDFYDKESEDIVAELRKLYLDLGECLYFDLAPQTHAVLYELCNKKINWIWYVNQPEPQLKGTSVTTKVSSECIAEMHNEAEKYWLPELVKVIRGTKEPFLNVIYDAEPLDRIVWDKVVLVGDAAHPTTPHGLRSTNMSIMDAVVLGKCLEKWGVEDLSSALDEYQHIRQHVVSKQVMFSRRLGRIKQGLPLEDGPCFDPENHEDCEMLQQKNMPFLLEVPPLLSSIHSLNV